MSADAPQQDFVDTRLDLRTPNFDGIDAHWGSWVLKFEAYCHLAGLGDVMEAATSSLIAIVMEELGEEAQTKSKNLYALLVSKCDGRALALISLTKGKNGFEASLLSNL